MTPQETFNALMEGKKVKLIDKEFNRINKELEVEAITTNVFWVYQIEASVVNLYNEELETVFHDFSFKDISLF